MTTTARRSAKDIYTEQIVERKNKLNSLKGEEPVSEEYVSSLASYKMYELKEMVGSLDRQLADFDLKKEVEAYFAGVGKKLHAKIQRIMASNKKCIEKSLKRVEKLAKSITNKTPWQIYSTDIVYDAVRIVLCMKDDEDTVFGSQVDLSYRVNGWDEESGEGQLLCNVGTTGSFNIQKEEACSRVQYYIRLGQMLGNKELMQKVADESKAALEAYRKAKKSQWLCGRVLENPFKNKLEED